MNDPGRPEHDRGPEVSRPFTDDEVVECARAGAFAAGGPWWRDRGAEARAAMLEAAAQVISGAEVTASVGDEEARRRFIAAASLCADSIRRRNSARGGTR